MPDATWRDIAAAAIEADKPTARRQPRGRVPVLRSGPRPTVLGEHGADAQPASRATAERQTARVMVSLRTLQLSLPCPECGAPAGTPCGGFISGADEVLGAHTARRHAALALRDRPDDPMYPKAAGE